MPLSRPRSRLSLVYTLALVLLFAHSSPALSAEPGEAAGKPLNVAVAECPPFVIVNEGRYSGLAIFLWERVGQEMGLSWEYSEYPLGVMLGAITSGSGERSADLGISCISVTAEREKLIDFSHSFTETHTAIAVRQTSLGSAVIGFLTNSRVLSAALIVLGLAVLIGVVFFFLEHKNNKRLFSSKSPVGKTLETTILGLHFVTSGPIRFYRFKTLTARVLATVLALSSTFLIAGVTAVLASSFTLQSLQTKVQDLQDLRRVRVGALDASTSSAILRQNGIAHQTRPDLDALVNDLDAGVLDAIVSDAAFLQYRINRGKAQGKFEALTVLPNELEAQNYAFALQNNSPYREEINRALLAVRKQTDWRQKEAEYLGE